MDKRRKKKAISSHLVEGSGREMQGCYGINEDSEVSGSVSGGCVERAW